MDRNQEEESMNQILRPWENVDPSPLPDVDASLLAELYEYAEQIADADTRADSTSMDKAAKLEALYTSTAWSDEWSAAKPPKPHDAVGRPVDPRSRNRFNEWLQWRAEKENRHALNRASIYRLLTAREVSSYIAPGRYKSEKSLRPWAWMLKAKYGERLPEVERMALEIANGKPVTESVARKALAQWKLEVLGGREAKKASLGITARSRRKVVEADFKDLLMHDANEAREFIKWAADQLRLRAVPAKGEESA
jgi:hypothetical protein